MRTAAAIDLEPACEAARSGFTTQPTLRLTLAQARRLWSLDHAMCQRVLDRLVHSGYLAVADDGRYCRPDCRDAASGWDRPCVGRSASVSPPRRRSAHHA
jgi:hypothetical protein